MTTTAKILRPTQSELDAHVDWTAPYIDLIDDVLNLILMDNGGPYSEDTYLACEEMAEQIVAENAE